MSEEKQYNDQWDDLSLPDGDIAWQKMELLLDKEEKRRVVPLWLWRYAGLGLLLVGLAIGGWLWLTAETENQQKPTPSQAQTTTQPNQQLEALPVNKTKEKNQTIDTERSEENQQNSTSSTTTEPVVINNQQQGANRIVKKNTSSNNTSVKQQKILKRVDHPEKVQLLISNAQPTLQKQKTDDPITENSIPAKENSVPTNTPKSETEQTAVVTRVDSTAKKDSAKAEQPNNVKEAKQDSAKKKAALVVSAGVGFQQAIALNGQQSASVNYKGKKGTLSDRIPSVYVQVQKGKWFVQAEFQYASPQPVQPFTFSQKTKYDAANSSLNTERFTIQKLYYHQLPFSINYQPITNWSVGAGAIYNILAGAVTEQEVQSKNIQSGTESVVRNLAPVQGYKDSFLYKSTAGILVQTDYHFGRFSLGLRYTQNLQSFIKYTRPDGQVLDEKNKVLQAILRIRLWHHQ